MAGKTAILWLSVLYFATAGSYVIVILPEPNDSVQQNQIKDDAPFDVANGDSSSSDIVTENWNNWYNVALASEDDTKCGTTDKEYTFFESTQSCYKVHTERATWSDAEYTCAYEGGHLAVIDSRDEAQILARQFPSGFRVVHIGFIWIRNFKIWMTVNGQILADTGYVNWAVGEPNNITGDQYCGSMYPDGSFDDIACSDETAFICEKSAKLQPQPDTSEANQPPTATKPPTQFETTEAGDISDEEESSVRSINSQNHPPTATEAQTKFETTETDDISDEEESSVKSTNSQSHPPTTTEAQTIFETTETDSKFDQEDTDTWFNQPTSVEVHMHECGTIDTGYTFFETTKACYKFHTNRETWDDAQATCVREGGHLAVINSQDEADFFMENFPLRSYLVFLGFHAKDDSWVTVQGQTLAEAGYEHWYEDEPINEFGVEYCGAMYRDGTFYDVPCDYDATFICERGPIFHLPTTASEVRTNFDTTERDDTSEEESADTESSSKPTSIEALNKCGTLDTEYTFYVNTQTCYMVHTNRATWDDAEATCVREGGHLAVINSQDEADFFMRHFPQEFYQVFLGFRLKENSWVTIQGQTLAETGYENWNIGEPNNVTGDQYCGSMYPDGTFDDISCSYRTAFICEKKPTAENHESTTAETNSDTSIDDEDDTSDEEESSGMEIRPTFIKADNECGTTDEEYTFYESTKSCYKVHTDRATWNDAASTCVREGGHLAVINSQDEADILMKLYPEHAVHVFIGYSYRTPFGSDDMYSIRRDGEWLTIDGQTLAEAGYEKWTKGEPNNAGGREYCGTIYGNGYFDDSACYDLFDYICEINRD